MIGDRIKCKRMADGLSLRELSDALKLNDIHLTPAALSNYETGKTIPNAAMLDILSKELGVQPSFFLEEDTIPIEVHFYHPTGFNPTKEGMLSCYTQLYLEKYLNLFAKNPHRPEKQLIKPVQIKKGDEELVDKIAYEQRLKWGAGTLPISSVCGMLEANGWLMLYLPEMYNLDAISGYDSIQQTHFVLYKANTLTDEIRHLFLKEAAYAYVCGENEEHTQLLATRFADEILFPKCRVFAELGEHISSISFTELGIYKQSYGISRKGILRRLKDLNILSEEGFNEIFTWLCQLGYPSKQYYQKDYIHFDENPTLFQKEVLRCGSEKILSKEEVDALIPLGIK